VPGEVNPGRPDSSGDVVKGVLNLMGGVTNQARCRFGGTAATRSAGKAAQLAALVRMVRRFA